MDFNTFVGVIARNKHTNAKDLTDEAWIRGGINPTQMGTILVHPRKMDNQLDPNKMVYEHFKLKPINVISSEEIRDMLSFNADF